jgi:hypothetical protein
MQLEMNEKIQGLADYVQGLEPDWSVSVSGKLVSIWKSSVQWEECCRSLKSPEQCYKFELKVFSFVGVEIIEKK